MKFLIFVCIAVVISRTKAFTEEEKKMIRAIHEACLPVSGVDEEVVIKASQGNFVDDQKFKDHLFCFAKEAGIQNEEGELNKELLRAKLLAEDHDYEEVNVIMDRCTVLRETPQDTIFEALKCYYETSTKHINLN